MDHPEQDLNRLNAPQASGNLPMADKRALALPTRRPRSPSHHSSDPTGAPKSLKLEVLFQEHPWKSPGQKDWADEHAGMTSVLSKLTVSPTRRKPSMRAVRKQWTAGAEPAQKPSSRKKEQISMPPGCEASVAARASAMAGWIAKAKRTGPRGLLAGLPSAGNGLQGYAAGTGEQGALVAITAVNPRRAGRKVDAHGLQDSVPVNRVESVGHVHRDGDLARV